MIWHDVKEFLEEAFQVLMGLMLLLLAGGVTAVMLKAVLLFLLFGGE